MGSRPYLNPSELCSPSTVSTRSLTASVKLVVTSSCVACCALSLMLDFDCVKTPSMGISQLDSFSVLTGAGHPLFGGSVVLIPKISQLVYTSMAPSAFSAWMCMCIGGMCGKARVCLVDQKSALKCKSAYLF